MRCVPVTLVLALALGPDRLAQARDEDNDKKEPKESTEVDFVPLVGGSSDIGLGGGGVGAITRFAPVSREEREPWQWRIEANALVTFRISHGLTAAYQDHWLLLTLPRLLHERLRVTARAAFTRETSVRYFGVGDATPLPPDDASPGYTFERTHPTLAGHARAALLPHFFATAGVSCTVNWLSVPADGKLAKDMQAGSPEVRSLLGDARTHAVVLLDSAVSWDSRNDEVVPRRGTWDEITMRVSPHIGEAAPYGYTEILAIARAYAPIGSRVVVAVRGLGDVLLGTPPFYHLAEYDDTYAIGGSAGLRGVPGQRYYGKVKLIGNVEVRTDVTRVRAIGKPWGISLVAFFDAGRLWADTSPHPELDGTGLGLKWGTGLGVRVQQGRAFVVRGDVAWSPDAQPIGGYFAAGETF